MAVHMDKPSEISPGERAQRLYKKNAELEKACRKSAHARIPPDPIVWQQMRENFEEMILVDNVFSEKHDIELALWQLHHKKIEELRGLYNAALNGNSGHARPDRLASIRSQFKTFLSEATGFYHELMLKIRAKYGLPLDYFLDDPESQVFLSSNEQRFADIKKGLISCYRCLIYLGDLARYKSLYGDVDSKARDLSAASSYYMQASSLWPSGGNPHHQLAIVAAYHDDEFSATYRYFRSLAVESPFVTARDNLIIAFERNRQSYSQLITDSRTSKVKAATSQMSGKGKGRGESRFLSKENRGKTTPSKEKTPSIQETLKSFCIKFVRVNGILFTRTSQETFTDVLAMSQSDFLMLLSSGLEEQYSFGSNASECGLFIVRLVAILIFTVHNVNREPESQSYADILQRPVLLQSAYTAIFEFMGHVVRRCLQLRDPFSSYLLPSILVFVEWLACHPDVVACSEEGENQVSARLLFWNSCITFFNKLLSSGFMSKDEDDTCFFNTIKYEESETANLFALWEDFELRGFLPLHPAQQILDFSKKHTYGNGKGTMEKEARIQRIIAAGKVFANVARVGKQGIYYDTDMKKFVLCEEAPPYPASLTKTRISNVISQEPLVEKITSPRVLEPVKVVEVEDEEEVIVFKPFAADKQYDYPILDSYEDLGLVADAGDLGVFDLTISGSPKEDVQNGEHKNSPVAILRPSMSVADSAPHHPHPIQLDTSGWLSEQQPSAMNGLKNLSLMDNGNLMNQNLSEPFARSRNENLPSGKHQNSPGATLRPSMSVADYVSHRPQPVPLNTSGWLSEQQDSVMNGFKNLSLMDNGNLMNQNSSGHFAPFQSSALSLPFSHAVNLNNSNVYPVHVPETVLPSKTDLITPGNDFAISPIKAKSIIPPGARKNPVSRPIRHLGPPPGFTPATIEFGDAPVDDQYVKNENVIMDDYSWLDGYQMPSSKKQDKLFSVCNNLTGASFNHFGKWSGTPGAMSFPFPGKQASLIQSPIENNKLWQDFQFPDLNYPQQKVHQQEMPLAEQFQGQSLWEGRYLV
ncbi:unnamed protein product [Amaranthus hypochondriacus]